MDSDNNTGERGQVPSVPSVPPVPSNAAALREALKEIEAHITATLAHQPDDDAECGQFLYNALVKVFNIADMACHERRGLRKYNNAAKLRDIVEVLALVILPPQNEYPAEYGGGKIPDDGWLAWLRPMQSAARAALAAPPRNCDIYLTEEAVDAATVTVRNCGACSRIDMEAPCVFCMVRWLLAPATKKEGGAK